MNIASTVEAPINQLRSANPNEIQGNAFSTQGVDDTRAKTVSRGLGRNKT
jgi:hypothetical protein